MSTESAGRIKVKEWFAAQDRSRLPVRKHQEFYRHLPPYPRPIACGFIDPLPIEIHIQSLEGGGSSFQMIGPEAPQHAAIGRFVTSDEALFLGALNAARQRISENVTQKLIATVDELQLLVHARERTVPAIARLIGVDGALNEIVEMATQLFGAPVTVSVGEVHEPSLVVTANVGADADVNACRERENIWYDRLIEIAPQADGRVFLFVNYE